TELLDMLIGALGMAMKAVAAGPATVQLAHCFSILPKIGLSEADLSDAQLADWAAVAESTGTLIEVNEKWGCPGPRAVRAAIAAGARLVAASDAHLATEVGRYERVADILAEARA
ncbi:MAG: histidinol-phosphatase, partial [Rhodoglobus sp.]